MSLVPEIRNGQGTQSIIPYDAARDTLLETIVVLTFRWVSTSEDNTLHNSLLNQDHHVATYSKNKWWFFFGFSFFFWGFSIYYKAIYLSSYRAISHRTEFHNHVVGSVSIEKERRKYPVVTLDISVLSFSVQRIMRETPVYHPSSTSNTEKS